MTFEQVTAQIIGIFVMIVSVVAVNLKSSVKILVAEFIMNAAVVANYLLLGGITGAYLCIVATVHTVISYWYTKKQKVFPPIMTVLFIALYMACSAYTYKSAIDILPAICAVLFALAIVQKKPAGYRMLKCINSFIYVIYDISIMAYTTSLTHGFLFVSALIAIIRLDIKNKKVL